MPKDKRASFRVLRAKNWEPSFPSIAKLSLKSKGKMKTFGHVHCLRKLLSHKLPGGGAGWRAQGEGLGAHRCQEAWWRPGLQEGAGGFDMQGSKSCFGSCLSTSQTEEPRPACPAQIFPSWMPVLLSSRPLFLGCGNGMIPKLGVISLAWLWGLEEAMPKLLIWLGTWPLKGLL